MKHVGPAAAPEDLESEDPASDASGPEDDDIADPSGIATHTD
jgi:hypothetical protein